MISMKKALVVATIASALSGCGRDNYNGKYIGYETKVFAATQNVGNYYQQNLDERVELDLKHDGDIVSGTITYPDTGLSGRFSAVSEKANKLDRVEIRMGMNSQMYQPGYGNTGSNMGYSTMCVGAFSGSLEAPGDGRILSGTLTALNATNGSLGGMGSTCTGKSLSVNKN